MKTVKVHIKNFKNIEDFTADFNGQNVIILGDNEVGKSSLLQFIRIAIGDKKCIPPGATGEGEVVMDMKGKNVTFKLKFVDGRPVIKVSGDGISIDNNKGAIAALVGATEFDPDKFVNLSATVAGRREQVNEFKKFLDEEVRTILSKCEANIANHYEDRKLINKEVSNLEGSIKLNPMYNHIHELDKFCPVDIQGVIAERDKAVTNNNNIAKVKSDVEQLDKTILNARKEISELQAKIDAHNAVIDASIEKINKANDWFRTHHIIDTKNFDDQINSATEINKKAADAQVLKSELKKLEDKKNESGELTALIESEKQCIIDTIRDIEGPIEGLSFDDEQLLYKGVPVNPDSLSTSTIAELGVKLKRAENPNIPIILQCSESWGQKRFDWLKEWAKKDDFQFIAERVESGVEKLEIQILGE